jgi:hypothetical protein
MDGVTLEGHRVLAKREDLLSYRNQFHLFRFIAFGARPLVDLLCQLKVNLIRAFSEHRTVTNSH